MLKHILFALTVVFFLTDSAKAQTEDIRFEHINVQDGLTDFMIFYIYQDVNGFMWFSEALQRYDGRNLKSYSGGIYEIRLGELLRGNWGRELAC